MKRETDAVSDLAALANSGEQYAVIYADPPWSFKVYSGKGKSRSVENHYDAMDQAGSHGPTRPAADNDDSD